MMATPAIYLAVTGAVVGLIFGFIVKPRTVNRGRSTQVRRAGIAAGLGAGLGLAIFYVAIELGVI